MKSCSPKRAFITICSWHRRQCNRPDTLLIPMRTHMKIRGILSEILSDLYRIRYAILILILYAIPMQLIFGTVCPFAILFGFPCPACGLTRAGLLLLKGSWKAAWATHPCIFLWVALILYLIISRYFLRKKTIPALPLASMVCLITLIYFCICCVNQSTISVPCEGILTYFYRNA
ncbi:MAG: DUF2752 domain-containing protein [Lachnospiraceae bacterium]|nr:DUF2752 domain-containing protein [Lachnospiraceae bacterium]